MAYVHSIEVMLVTLDFETNRPTPIQEATRTWLEGQA